MKLLKIALLALPLTGYASGAQSLMALHVNEAASRISNQFHLDTSAGPNLRFAPKIIKLGANEYAEGFSLPSSALPPGFGASAKPILASILIACGSGQKDQLLSTEALAVLGVPNYYQIAEPSDLAHFGDQPAPWKVELYWRTADNLKFVYVNSPTRNKASKEATPYPSEFLGYADAKSTFDINASQPTSKFENNYSLAAVASRDIGPFRVDVDALYSAQQHGKAPACDFRQVNKPNLPFLPPTLQSNFTSNSGLTSFKFEASGGRITEIGFNAPADVTEPPIRTMGTPAIGNIGSVYLDASFSVAAKTKQKIWGSVFMGTIPQVSDHASTHESDKSRGTPQAIFDWVAKQAGSPTQIIRSGAFWKNGESSNDMYIWKLPNRQGTIRLTLLKTRQNGQSFLDWYLFESTF